MLLSLRSLIETASAVVSGTDTETLTLSELITAAQSVLSSRTESTAVAETSSAIGQGNSAQQEGVVTSTTSSASAIFVPQVTEIVAFLDAVGAVAQRLAAVAESATPTTAEAAGMLGVAAQSEMVVGTSTSNQTSAMGSATAESITPGEVTMSVRRTSANQAEGVITATTSTTTAPMPVSLVELLVPVSTAQAGAALMAGHSNTLAVSVGALASFVGSTSLTEVGAVGDVGATVVAFPVQAVNPATVNDTSASVAVYLVQQFEATSVEATSAGSAVLVATGDGAVVLLAGANSYQELIAERLEGVLLGDVPFAYYPVDAGIEEVIAATASASGWFFVVIPLDRLRGTGMVVTPHQVVATAQSQSIRCETRATGLMAQAVALSPRATVTVAELRAAVMVVWE